LIRLQANTAEFSSSLEKVKHELAGLKGGADTAGHAVVNDMTKSRESVVLLGEEFGVKMPRALSMLISRLPGVAAAMEIAFPIVGIVAVIAIISKLALEYDNLQQKIREAGQTTERFGIKQEDASLSIHDSNLALEDQIAKLEGRPTVNTLAIALDQIKLKADGLASSMAADFSKMDNAVYKGTGVWHDLYMMVDQTISMGIEGGTEEAYKIGDVTNATNKRKKAQDDLNTAMDAASSISDKHSSGYKKALNDERNAANELAIAWHNEYTAMQKSGSASDAAMNAAKQGAMAATAEVSQLGQTIERVGLVRVDTNLKTNNANAQLGVKLTEAQTAAVKAHDAALMHEAQTQMMGGMAAARGGQSPDAMLAASRAAAQAQRDEDIQAAQQTLAAETNVYEAKRNAAKGNVTELKVLAIGYLASKQAFNDAEVNANLQMNERISVANAAYERLEATHEKMLTAQHRRELQNRLQDTIVTDQQKIQAAKDAASGHISHLHTQASAGVISKQAEQEGILAILHKEQADMKAMYGREIADKKSYADQMKALEKASVGTSNEAGAIANATHAQDAYSKAVEKAAKDQQALNNQLFATNAALAQMKPSWSNVADQMRKDLPTLGKETSDLSMQFEHGLNQSIAQAIVSGKDFGQSMRQVFASLTTGIIGYILQYIELAAVQAIAKNIGGGAGGNTGKEIAQNKAMQVSEAQVAGAKAMATSPFPLDLVIGPAVFAAAMAFAGGGIVPGNGRGDTVPAMLTPGESVLPKAMTQNLSRASGGMTIHNHNNYSPQIHAIDATGVDGMLTKHGAVFQRHIAAQMRRMNQ